MPLYTHTHAKQNSHGFSVFWYNYRIAAVVIALVTLVTLGSNVFTHAPTQMRAMVTALVLAALPDAFAIATRSIGAHRANSVPMGILAGLIAS